MKTLLVCVLIVIGGVVFGWKRNGAIGDQRRQNAELRDTIAEIERYKRDLTGVNRTEVDTNELHRLRSERSELLKLRSEIGNLRQVSQIDLPEIQRLVELTSNQTVAIRRRGADLVAERAAKLQSSLVRDHLRYYLLGPLRNVAKANNGNYPQSMAEAEALCQMLPEKEQQWALHTLFQTQKVNPNETTIIGRSYSVSAKDFEFVPVTSPLTLSHPPVVLLREIAPRKLPDGTFARYYGFTDGNVTEVSSAGGDFSEWEHQQNAKAQIR